MPAPNPQPRQITDVEALDRISKWTEFNFDPDLPNVFSTDDIFFHTGPDFQHHHFPAFKDVHAYFGFEGDPMHSGQLSHESGLVLILVSAEKDHPALLPNAYIYQLPYGGLATDNLSGVPTPGDNPPSEPVPNSLAQQWIDTWNANYTSWIHNRQNGIGMVRANNVPFGDVSAFFEQSGPEIMVVPGLRDLNDPHNDLSLLFFKSHPSGRSFAPADFSTPVPPLGQNGFNLLN